MGVRFVELNHVLEEGMPTYPGIPPPRFGALLTHEESRPRYDEQAEFRLGMVEMPGNTGTYLDVPFHRFRGGPDLAAVPLESVAGLPGVVLDADTSAGRAVQLELGHRRVSGHAVLIRTGWDERWGTDRYWEPGPYLSAEALEALVSGGPALVGVDCWQVDDPDDPARPAHTALLEAGILIVEHLRGLSALPPDGFRFFAVPLRIRGGTSIPVRAFAEVPIP